VEFGAARQIALELLIDVRLAPFIARGEVDGELQQKRIFLPR
jgi:hypothetical protein